MGIQYNLATISFPASAPYTAPNEPQFLLDKLVFVRNGFHVAAHITPFYLPPGLSEHPVVQEAVIKPAVQTVSNDIATIDDLLPTLVKMSEVTMVQDQLHYTKHYEGKKPIFRVYDYSQSFPEAKDRDDRLFARVLWFQNANKNIVPAENHDLIDKAQYVGQIPTKIAHVEGSNLREAVERAIEIYNMTIRLRNLSHR